MYMNRRLCSVGSFFVVVICSAYYIISYYDALFTASSALSSEEGGKAPPTPAALMSAVEVESLWNDSGRLSARRTRRERCRAGGRCGPRKTIRSRDVISPLDYGDLRPRLEEDILDEENPTWAEFANKGYTFVVNGGSLMRRLPNVLIIGAKKCGTRALLDFLRVHPSIKAAGPEMHFFNKYYHLGPAWYRSRQPLTLEGQVTIEKTPAYFTSPQVPARVKQLLPGVRLLLVVKNPVVRAVSDYVQSRSKHSHESTKSFKELAFVNETTGLLKAKWGPISGGLYATHLSRWLEHFPLSCLHIVDGEHLIQDPANELAGVQDFLGLRRIISERHFFFNVTKGFPCLVKREKGGRPYCLGSTKGRKHPDIGAKTVQVLKDFYRPFNHRFFKMVNRWFDWD